MLSGIFRGRITMNSMSRRFAFLSLPLLLCSGTIVRAQDDAHLGGASVAQSESVEECGQDSSRTVTLPKLTELTVQIGQALDSKSSVSGQKFPLALAEPLVLEGMEILPIGTPGVGEVIHAKKAGGSGAGGELILTALYLEEGDRKIPLRSMQLGVTGKNQTGLAMAVGVTPLGPLGLAVRGKNIEVPEGQWASAKLAEDTEFTVREESDRPADACSTEENGSEV